jgi:glycosyltransferase involved in cell wall biosynthesis
MYNVLRTIPSYFPNLSGPANQARAISRGLIPFGYTSTVVTTNFGAEQAPPRERLDGVEVIRAAVRAGVMQYHFAPDAWPSLRSQPADIIHVHSYRNFLADIAGTVALRRARPLVVHLHGTLVGYRAIARPSHWWLYHAYDTITRPLSLLRRARIVVSTSEEAHETEQYGIDRGRINIIPMGIDVDDYHFEDLQHDTTRIVFVGRLTEDRNPELLVRALALIAHLPWSCTLVGAEVRRSYATSLGYVERLKQLARELGIAGRVTFAGQLRGEPLRRAYAGAGIFVYPSRYENFGQTILEAAAAGCALVTTPVGVAHDLAGEGETGYFICADAPQALARQIARLLEHPQQQRAMGAEARARAQRGYAWQPILQRYADLYESMIDERAIQLKRVAGQGNTVGQHSGRKVQ